MQDRLELLDECLDRLRPRLRIAVIYGGDRREIGTVVNRTLQVRAWKSYRDVALELASSLRRLGFRRVSLLRERQGLASQVASQEIHLAWLNTGGIQGRDPLAHAAALLESMGIPYIGHPPAQSALLDNKVLFKHLLLGLNIPTPPYLFWHPAQGAPPRMGDERFRRAFGDPPPPVVVKPANGRASQLVHYVESQDELAQALTGVYRHTHHQVLIERFMPGREFALGGGPSVRRSDGAWIRRKPPWCFAHLERRLNPGEKIFQSQDERPITGERIRLLNRRNDGELMERLNRLCQGVYRALHLNALVRMDLREDDRGSLGILEVNPKPDLRFQGPDGGRSLLALGLKASGTSYDELILSQIASWLDYTLSHCLPAISPIVDLLGRRWRERI